jgi:succinyl-diaminopimelate desuccinylase
MKSNINNESKTVTLLKKLIAEPSVTPDDKQCQAIIADFLSPLGFTLESLVFADVKNLYARKGTDGPVLLFAGHTDVVPPGPEAKWLSPPFVPAVRDGILYGRGAADMKSGLAAMLAATARFIRNYPSHQGSIAFLITSDEEGHALNGTKRVVEELQNRNEAITWCIVGEASSEKVFGDVVKVGRRGSLNGDLTIYGTQGHIAYPQNADNPIHKSLLAIYDLCRNVWDQGNDYFPATSFQISNLHAGTGANNVIPGQLEVLFNFRYSPASTADQLQEKVHAILDSHKLNYALTWQLSGEPFLSVIGDLFEASSQAIEKVAGVQPRASTEGGTSDGRFIIKLGCQVLELGPINASIHQVNEHIRLEELELLTDVYYNILLRLLKA